MSPDASTLALREERRGMAAWLVGSAPRPPWRAFTEVLPPDLLPYAAHRLGRAGDHKTTPRELAGLMSHASRSSAALHLGHLSELRSAVSSLSANQIPTLVLKGMALAHSHYPTPSSRVMVDVDLGVPFDRLAEARAVLERTGLRVPERRARELRDTVGAWEGPLERPGTSRMLDLHGSLKLAQPPYCASVVKQRLTPELWACSRTLHLSGVQMRMLGREDALRHVGLHLACMHGFQHGLRSLLDVALILREPQAEFDWRALLDACGDLAPWMGLTLALAREDFDAPVADAVIDAFAPEGLQEEAKNLAREQLWESHRVHAPVGLLDILVGRRAVLRPRRFQDPTTTVGGGTRATNMDDIRRRLHVLKTTLRRGQLSPRRMGQALALRRAHWRLTDLMRVDT